MSSINCVLLNNSLNNKPNFIDLSSFVDITSYTENNPYTVPENGTIYINSGFSSSGGHARCLGVIKDEKNQTLFMPTYGYGGYTNATSLNVMKGWTVYCGENLAGNGIIRFYKNR